MQDYLFYHENDGYLIYQRTLFSNVYLITKEKNRKQYMDPDFFYRIITTSFSDTDILFAFPWVLDLDKFQKNKYIINYQKFWKNTNKKKMA